MSEQQVERLQALLETVQKNRQRPGQPGQPGQFGQRIGEGANVAAASVVQNKSPANMTEARANVPASARTRNPAQPEPPTAQIAAPAAPGAGAPPPPPARREPPAPAKAQARAPEPQPAAQEPIVPRTFESDPPRASTRPIAQLVSKHAPVVDATFGAMLKRSLSLRPH